MNSETGEVIKLCSDNDVETLEGRNTRKHLALQRERRMFGKYQIDDRFTDFGTFFWVEFDNENELFKDITPQDVARLLHIVSFMDYNNRIRTGNGFATKNDIMDMLQVKRSLRYKVFETLMSKEYIYPVAENGVECFKANDYLFFKGQTRNRKAVRRVRIYIEPYRNLYSFYGELGHKNIGKAIKTIPYINCQYNILCHNQNESELSKITPMKMSELCKISNESNRTRLSNALLDLTFQNDIYYEKLFIRKEVTLGNKTRKCIYVNPRVIYGGSVRNLITLQDNLNFIDHEETKKGLC